MEHGSGLSGVRLPPYHQERKQDEVRRLEAFQVGRPQVGELSAGALETLQSSWAKNTKECYGLGFRYWTQYCRRNQLDESSLSAVNLINFLQFEFEKNGKQYRTINTYRSAVSAMLGTCPVRGVPVGQDPLVCRFMRGLLRLIPPKTKLFPTWELVTVLNKLISWGEVTQLSL